MRGSLRIPDWRESRLAASPGLLLPFRHLARYSDSIRRPPIETSSRSSAPESSSGANDIHHLCQQVPSAARRLPFERLDSAFAPGSAKGEQRC